MSVSVTKEAAPQKTLMKTKRGGGGGVRLVPTQPLCKIWSNDTPSAGCAIVAEQPPPPDTDATVLYCTYCITYWDLPTVPTYHLPTDTLGRPPPSNPDWPHALLGCSPLCNLLRRFIMYSREPWAVTVECESLLNPPSSCLFLLPTSSLLDETQLQQKPIPPNFALFLFFRLSLKSHCFLFPSPHTLALFPFAAISRCNCKALTLCYTNTNNPLGCSCCPYQRNTHTKKIQKRTITPTRTRLLSHPLETYGSVSGH